MSVALVPMVKADSIACEKSSHNCGYWSVPGFKEKMNVIGEQRPRIAGGGGILHDSAKAAEKIVFIFIVFKYPLALYSSYHDMVQGTWGIYSGLTGHERMVAKSLCNVKLLFHGRPLLPITIRFLRAGIFAVLL